MKKSTIAVVLAALALPMAGCGAEGDRGDDGPTSEGRLQGNASYANVVGAPVFSPDGRYAVVMRAIGSGPRPFSVVRIELASKQEKEVGTVDDDAWYNSELVPRDVGFAVHTFNRGTTVAADFELTRIVKLDQTRLYVAPSGRFYVKEKFMDMSGHDSKLFVGPLHGAEPEREVGTRNDFFSPVWRENSFLFVSQDGITYKKRRLDAKTGALGPEVSDPMPHGYQYGSRFDGERLYLAQLKNDSGAVRVDLSATDMTTGVSTPLGVGAYVTDPDLIGSYNTGGLYAPEKTPYLLFFGTTGGPVPATVAQIVKKTGGTPVAFDGVTCAAFRTVVGDSGAVSTIDAEGYDVVPADGGNKLAIVGTRRSVLLDPVSKQITELGQNAVRVGESFWSAADRKLVDKKGVTLYTGAEAESDTLRYEVAGDGETVWILSSKECDGAKVHVATSRRSQEADLGCQALDIKGQFTPVGSTSHLAFTGHGTMTLL